MDLSPSAEFFFSFKITLNCHLGISETETEKKSLETNS